MACDMKLRRKYLPHTVLLKVKVTIHIHNVLEDLKGRSRISSIPISTVTFLHIQMGLEQSLPYRNCRIAYFSLIDGCFPHLLHETRTDGMDVERVTVR